MTSDSSAPCPRCGHALPADAPEGLCPRCLGALPLDTATLLPGQPHEPAPPLSPADLAPLFPQLEILECLGRGGMGVVYKARQKSLNRLVALKLLAPERVRDSGFAERFAREAHALAALNHPHIVTVYDFGQVTGGSQEPLYFLLMELVDGVNLRQAMKAGRFTPEQALAIVPPVCEALQYAHEHGIVHRDIKPENLLLDKEGRVKIADFGIAKILGAPAAEEELAASQPAGTPQYMAPEQKGPHATDHRADIYSLGVVLYELLTGELPADKLQPPSRKVHIDVRLDEIVLRALAAAPERRYQTALEFRTQVETVAQDSSAPLPQNLSSTQARQLLYQAMGYRTKWGRRCLSLAWLGFLGFMGFAPGCQPLLGCFGLFGFLGVAVLFELAARWKEPGPRLKPLVLGVLGVLAALAVAVTVIHRVRTQVAPRPLELVFNEPPAVVPGTSPDKAQPTTNVSGIGVALARTEGQRGSFIITQIVAGSPAAEDGRLKPGDWIEAIGDNEDTLVKVLGWKLTDVVARMRGPENSPLCLKITPAGRDFSHSYVLTLKRRALKL